MKKFKISSFDSVIGSNEISSVTQYRFLPKEINQEKDKKRKVGIKIVQQVIMVKKQISGFSYFLYVIKSWFH